LTHTSSVNESLNHIGLPD